MFLTADPHLSLETVGRRGNLRIRVAALELHWRDHQGFIRQRRLKIEHRRQVRIFDRRKSCGPTRLIAGFGGHREQGLADKLGGRFGKHRLVHCMGGADIVLAGNIAGRDDTANPFRRPNSGQIELDDFGMRAFTDPDVGMQQIAGLGHVVHVDRLARDMSRGAVVDNGLMDTTLYLIRIIRHWRPPGRG